jgi:6-phosphofructokinase 2
MDSMHRILTLTLNPAIDLTTSVSKMVPGRKLRCEPPRIHPGGGGVNVSRTIKELGGTSVALVAVGGTTGAQMRELLAGAGIDAVFIDAKGSTRQSFAVHDRSTGEQFRFVLPGPTQDNAFAERTLSVLTELLAAGDYRHVVASGSLPLGLPVGFYGSVAEVVNASGARLILDASGPALEAALGRGVFLLRINAGEAQLLAEILNIDPNNPERLCRTIVNERAADVVIVALGAEGALLVSGAGAVRIQSPHVEVASPVGAGDSFVGALTFALSEGWSLESACAYGVAAAAAAVTTEATELARKADVDRLYAGMGGELPNVTSCA